MSTANDSAAFVALANVTTATLTTVLLKKGLRNVWIRGAFSLTSNQPRIVGRAFTVRFIPAREDLATPASWSSPKSTRAAIELMPAGCIAVIDANGVTDAGFWGDILCARMAVRGVAGLVTRRDWWVNGIWGPSTRAITRMHEGLTRRCAFVAGCTITTTGDWNTTSKSFEPTDAI